MNIGLALLAIVFVGDSLAGLVILKQAMKMEVSSFSVDGHYNSMLLKQALKPTFVKGFVFSKWKTLRVWFRFDICSSLFKLKQPL